MVFLFGFYSSYAMLKLYETPKTLPRVWWAISGFLSLISGALCKPDAFIFLGVTALILYFFSSKGARAVIISLLCMVLFILFSGRIIHHYVLPYSNYHRSFIYIENPLVGVHWYQKIALAFSTVWFYIGKMIFPKDLVSYYGYNAFDAFPEWTNFSVMAGIILTLLLVWLIIKNIKKKTALLFMLLLFAGTAFPYTDITEVGAGIVAERFMFIPSLSFLFLITYLLFYILKIPVDKKPAGQKATYLYAFTISVCIIFTARVLARNPDWKSHETLYLHDSKVAPNSAKLQALLGGIYVGEAQDLMVNAPQQKADIASLYEKAEEAYQRSVDIYPEYGTSWNNVGMISYTLYADAPRAISAFEKAIKIDSDYTEAWFNRGACYQSLADRVADSLHHDSLQLAEEKRFEKPEDDALNKKMFARETRVETYRDISERSYLRAIKLTPNYYIAYIYISRLYTSEARYNKILEMDSAALKKGYQSDPIYLTLGNAFIMLKDTDNAAVNYEKAMRFYNRNYYICNFLQGYYYKKGNMEKARYYKQLYDEAIDQGSDHTTR